MSRLVRVLWLVGLWAALWSKFSVATVAGGLVVALAVVALFDPWRPGSVVIRPVRVLWLAANFAVLLVQSSVQVAWAVLVPHRRVHTGIVAVPLQGCTDAVATVLADAITLTPGTLTIEVRRDPLTLYVHALDARDVDQVRRDVRRLEVLVVRAFGDADALAGLDVDDTTAWEAS